MAYRHMATKMWQMAGSRQQVRLWLARLGHLPTKSAICERHLPTKLACVAYGFGVPFTNAAPAESACILPTAA
jgi:hypothetical protein